MSAKMIVGGLVNISKTSFTRPNDTTTYAAGDVMADSTSAATILTFGSCAQFSGGTGLIQAATLIDGANQTLKLDADLFLFTVAPASYGNDNAAFTPTDAELQNCVGVINFASSSFKNGDATAGAGGNAICSAANLAIPFKCAGTDTALYGVLVARNAYIPIASSPFYPQLLVLQD